MHRRLAAAIERREPESADANAAMIAEHLEAAGDLDAAYGWHASRSVVGQPRHRGGAAQLAERGRRGRQTPGRRPEPDGDAHRAAHTLCGSAWRVHASIFGTRFDELRQLCEQAGDKASMAIGMAGLVMEHANHA